MEASNGLLSNSGKTVTISMRIILYLNLFHQLAILALVEVAKVQCFLWVACFGIDALSMPVVLSSILVARLSLSSFRKESFYFQLPPQSTKEPPILKKKQMILF
jgi:hypothetical protein